MLDSCFFIIFNNSKYVAKILANAKYGFAIESREFNSVLVAFPLVAVIQHNVFLFASFQEIHQRTSYPQTRHLYEYSIGLVISVSFFAYSKIRAIHFLQISASICDLLSS